MNKKSKIKVTDDKLVEVKLNIKIKPKTFEYPGSFPDSEVFSMNNFSKNLKMEVKELNDEEIVFDLFDIEPPLANALRRILISEIPTMAIEFVRITQNTSIIPDEVLAHRLGLIPIFADADEFNYKKGIYILILRIRRIKRTKLYQI